MLRTCLLLCVVIPVQAQTQPQPAAPMGFQPVQTLGVGRAGRGLAAMPIPRAETGKPFSATVTTQTVQTLIDGTHVSQTTTMVEYRDAEGRVRTETAQRAGRATEPARTIVIRDPVAGVTWRLNPTLRSATRTATPVVPAAAARGTRIVRSDGSTEPPVVSVEIPQGTLRDLEIQLPRSPGLVEDLGTVNVNGVPARGTRFTTTVPAGAIGNDRDFRSVEERWFSSELNLLIKSVTTDPRFGTTTYELTNISRQPPDPGLFQVPPGYSVGSTNMIEAIEFSGANRVSQDMMKATVLTRVGDVYDQDAAGRDVKLLWNTGRFNDVQVKRETGPRGGVVLRFTVTERP
jgi:hypothetical protein